jgi:hypothetical protein
MPATFGRIHTWIAEVLNYAALNAEFDNILNNLGPTGISGYSTTVTQMRTDTDPGEVGTESLAPSLAGEIERLRYAIREIKGTDATYWYESVGTSLTDIINSLGSTLLNNRVSSGKQSANSSSPRYLTPAGSSNLLTLDATPSPFNYIIDGISYTLSADVTVTGLATAAASNNTCLVNDPNLALQESSKWQGEDGRTLIVDAMGSSITALIGTFAAFKIVHAGNTEYAMAYVKSSTELANVRRGYFFNSSLAAVPRIAIADNDTITVMRLTWVYVTTAGAINVGYTNPTYSYAQPSAASTGDYWYDITNDTWKKFDSVNWVAANAILIGLSVQDTTNVIAARAFDFFVQSDDYNNISLELLSTTQIGSIRAGAKIAIGASSLTFETTKPVWDITTNLESGYAEAASTTYFAYVGEDGQLRLSPEKPYRDAGVGKGYYHPYEMWRYVGRVTNNASSDFTDDTLVSGAMYEDFGNPLAVENFGITASVASNNLTVTLTTRDGQAPTTANPVIMGFSGTAATDGKPVYRRITSSLSITAPNGATLGHTSGLTQYVWVYLVVDNTTKIVDICLIGTTAPTEVYQTSATFGGVISAGSTSGTLLYGNAAHAAGGAVRLIGRYSINQATAGVWASAPIFLTMMPTRETAYTTWTQFTLSTSGTSGFGTITANTECFWRRVGDAIDLDINFTSGTVAGVQAQIALPTIGGTQLTTVARAANTYICGWQIAQDGTASALKPMLVPSTSQAYLQIGGVSGTTQAPQTPINGNVASQSSQPNRIEVRGVKITGWSQYGP